MRENAKKAAKEHERIVTALKNAETSQRQKHEKEIESLTESMMKLETDMVFLKKEVDELSKRNRMLESKNKALERRATQQLNQPQVRTDNSFDVTMTGATDTPSAFDAGSSIVRAVTPKRKSKSHAYRDGFDDNDISMMSPTSGKRGKQKTPIKVGSKRKRSVHDSPGQLVLSAPRPFVSEEPPSLLDGRTLDRLWSQGQDNRIDVCFEWPKKASSADQLQSFEALMIHRFPESGYKSFDELSRFSFPSHKGTTLSGVFFDSSMALRAGAPGPGFMLGVCRVLMQIWTRCLEEKLVSNDRRVNQGQWLMVDLV